MKRLLLVRQELTPHYTIGELREIDEYGKERKIMCKTLELAWRNNARNISCIPTGEYVIRRHVRPSGQVAVKVFSFDGENEVQDRTNILFHVGNYVNWNNDGVIQNDTDGCILPVSSIAQKTATGVFGASSRPQMDKLLDFVGNEGVSLLVRNAIYYTVSEPKEQAAKTVERITILFSDGTEVSYATSESRGL